MINIKNKITGLVVSALLAAILLVAQVCLAFLPNIELVSVLIIAYTLCLPKRVVLPAIYVFCVLQGVIYGFTIWWITYLYIWAILVVITHIFRKIENSFAWAIIGALYGLAFGALCSILYLFIGNFQTAFAFWIAGIPFDLLHCVGNFFTVLILLKPICYAIKRCISQ